MRKYCSSRDTAVVPLGRKAPGTVREEVMNFDNKDLVDEQRYMKGRSGKQGSIFEWKILVMMKSRKKKG